MAKRRQSGGKGRGLRASLGDLYPGRTEMQRGDIQRVGKDQIRINGKLYLIGEEVKPVTPATVRRIEATITKLERRERTVAAAWKPMAKLAQRVNRMDIALMDALEELEDVIEDITLPK